MVTIGSFDVAQQERLMTQQVHHLLQNLTLPHSAPVAASASPID